MDQAPTCRCCRGTLLVKSDALPAAASHLKWRWLLFLPHPCSSPDINRVDAAHPSNWKSCWIEELSQLMSKVTLKHFFHDFSHFTFLWPVSEHQTEACGSRGLPLCRGPSPTTRTSALRLAILRCKMLGPQDVRSWVHWKLNNFDNFGQTPQSPTNYLNGLEKTIV